MNLENLMPLLSRFLFSIPENSPQVCHVRERYLLRVQKMTVKP